MPSGPRRSKPRPRRVRHVNRTEAEIRKSLETLRSLRDGRPTTLAAQLVIPRGGGRSGLNLAALDAEYRRQSPDGPRPILSVRRGDDMDMDLLRHAFHVDVLEHAFGPDGGGLAEIEDRAAEARSFQALHRAANPGPPPRANPETATQAKGQGDAMNEPKPAGRGKNRKPATEVKITVTIERAPLTANQT
jgi:hypothetical protein